MTDDITPVRVATPPRPKARSPFAVRYSARDLLNVAIFAVIYFVVIYAVAMIGIISPVVMLITLPLGAIAAGIPYMLFLTRVRHAGVVTLFGVVIALLYLMVGQPWQSTVVTIVLAVLADAILWAGRYRSKRAATGAYVVFSGWFAGPWIPFFLDPAAYLQSAASQEMGEAYMREFQQVVTIPAVSATVVATLVCGFLGALLGTALLRKHFVRAGLA